ncbi:chitin-binding domain protein [Thermothelomyces thermophilus ATCC 42464]|uniref:Chitin-binding domain protein n=1 Tax=Thermothelomyces thermophilus (strain ATCC 42464 / BCRC 31852 / DSM 1799) TaxID=573729 RepID=G2QJ05_THET4|nr:chitin-binding domain protein [Thermothelomyces thermophilus ATCC 42464]AEO60424.1 chitin-binding domain protein [Thermothelomyces thermophilus ATCC 42464]
MHRLAYLVSLLPVVAAHGFVSSPPARRPGSAYRATCGEQPFYQQSSDINGNVQGIQQVVGKDMTDACNLWLCKGFVLDDNKDQVQSFSLGQTIDFKVNIAAPHTGYANVSVVKTSTNTVIGEPLIEFDNYASNNGVAANNTAFSVKLPSNLGGSCTTAGDCVLQWFWDAPDINQTYEACVDFTVGSGSGSGTSASPTDPTTTATPTSAPSTSSSSAAAATTTTTSAAAPPTSTEGAAPTTTATPVPNDEGDDEECPVDDDGEEDNDGEDDNADEECPADNGEDDEDGDKCIADDE